VDNTDLLGSGGFWLGPLFISEVVVSSWALMAVLGLAAWLATRRLQIQPDTLQTALEGAIGAIEEAIRGALGAYTPTVLPFIATLWIFLVTANLLGLIPGLSAPTHDLSVTSALAVLVFASAHYYGIRSQGLARYLRHYLSPSPILLPFHIIGEITRTLALAIRLFGNIMSLEMAALLILLVAGFLVPIPILMLHIVEALVQGYLFGMLALIYIAGGIQTQQLREQKKE
jgi:F-type H+-transporting ATPase subunit a